MKQLKFMILINLIISISYQQYLDLTFVPDVGLRLNDVGIQKAHLDSSGTYYLYYTQGPDSGVAISYDGLNFTFVSLQEYPDYRFQTMPNGINRRFFTVLEDNVAYLKSHSSQTNNNFTLDEGFRYIYPDNDYISSQNVYSTFFNNNFGEVYMIYLAGEIDNSRSVKSIENNNGWDFTIYHTNIFADSILGGGNQSYWDPSAIVLSDGRPRIFTMNQHGHPVPPAVPKGTIYSFTSPDEGNTFNQDDGMRLRYDSFQEFEVYSLNDPKVILLLDGRYRMYVASMIRTSPDNFIFGILSATTPNPESLGDPNLDNNKNVIDIIMIINYILGSTEFNSLQITLSNVNQNESVDILDIILIVNIILEN